MMIKKIFSLCLLAALITGIGKSWHWAKDGFNIVRISPIFREMGEMGAFQEEPFNQVFRYIGRGHQCYAFGSDDGKYVLKIPRFDHFDIPFWLKACNFSFLDSYRKKLKRDKKRRYNFLMNSFEIAHRELKEMTGIRYLHIHKTQSLRKRVKIIDRVGRAYELDLDCLSFILQKREPLMAPIFMKELEVENRERAKEILSAFLETIALRSRKGIFNKDPSFLKNFGFSKNRAIQIDIGSFYYKDEWIGKDAFEPSLQETVSHIRSWLEKTDQEILSWFNRHVEELIEKENQRAA